MRSNYTLDDIRQIEDDLEEKIREYEPDTHFSLDIPQTDDGFMRVEVYSPVDYSKHTPDQSTVAKAVRNYYGLDIEWENGYSDQSVYSIWISDLSQVETEDDILERTLG